MFELRPAGGGDGPHLQRVMGDPDVARWLRPAGADGPFSPAECARIAAGLAGHHAAHGFGTELAFHDGACIGWSRLGYSLVEGRPVVEIGWMVCSDRWGQGIGSMLGARAAERAHARGIAAVVAFTRVDNSRSQRVMEKLGLLRDREFAHAGLAHVLYLEPARGQDDSAAPTGRASGIGPTRG